MTICALPLGTKGLVCLLCISVEEDFVQLLCTYSNKDFSQLQKRKICMFSNTLLRTTARNIKGHNLMS